ncbi:phosphoribosylformylglycinamidine synthase subunit PurS [bacterium]|nr:phosphoribosylformylglycinamidine synthase subunit PurS [bacterium]
MKFKVEVFVSTRKDVLDPQGKAVEHALANLGFSGMTEVRVGKYLTFFIDAENRESAMAGVDDACEKLLTNPIIEDYEINLTEA